LKLALEVRTTGAASCCPFVVSDQSGWPYFRMKRAVNILNEAVTADYASSVVAALGIEQRLMWASVVAALGIEQRLMPTEGHSVMT
jgi:hypothetical protein